MLARWLDGDRLVPTAIENALRAQRFSSFELDIAICSSGAEVLALACVHGADRLVPPCDRHSALRAQRLHRQLDRYMFSQACAWLQQRIRSGKEPLNIAVNVSRLSIMQDDFSVLQ